MESFLLTLNHLPNGTTHVVYDIGPADRANVLTLSENAHHLLDTPASDLLAHTLADVRPPTTSRRHP